MIVRFVKDYRSRAWMCRFGAGAVSDVDRPEVLAEVLDGGFAVPESSVAASSTSEQEWVFGDSSDKNNDDEDDGA